MPVRPKDLVRAVGRRFAQARAALPFAVNDALFHLPVRATLDTPALARERGWEVRDLGHDPVRLPPCLEGSSERMLRALHASVSPPHPIPNAHRVFAAAIPLGRVLGAACTAIAPGGIVLADVSPHPGRPADEHRAISSRAVAFPPRRLGGTSALVGTIGGRNWYHWMFDILPRAGLVRDSGFAPIDRWLVPRSGLALARELMLRCGIDPERAVEVGAGAHVECERLVVTSAGGEVCRPTQRSVEFLRASLRAPEAGGGRDGAVPQARRIYLARRGRRALSNEQEILPFLRAHGFETVAMEGRSLDEQIAAVAGATAIVAPHGAGLAHLVHAAPGATLIELVPAEYPNPSFFVLAGACGMRYGVVEGQSLAGADPTESDFTVDPRALRTLVERLPS
jgi:Glycosyltransferase 61